MDSEGAVEQMAIGAADRPSEYGLDDQPEDDMVLVGEVSSHQIGSPGIEATLDADAVRMSPGKTDQRPAVTLGSKEEEQAATKIQAAQRGWKAHAEVQEMRRGEEAADHSDDANEAIPLIPGAPEEERAAAGIQAVQGGRMGSPRGASAAPEAGQGVATEQGMLQDTQTGQSTECGDSASLPLMVKAVIRIQSIVRGNRDRKKAHLTANPPSAPHTPTLLSSEQDSFFGDFGEEYFPEYDADDEARIIKVWRQPAQTGG